MSRVTRVNVKKLIDEIRRQMIVVGFMESTTFKVYTQLTSDQKCVVLRHFIDSDHPAEQPLVEIIEFITEVADELTEQKFFSLKTLKNFRYSPRKLRFVAATFDLPWMRMQFSNIGPALRRLEKIPRLPRTEVRRSYDCQSDKNVDAKHFADIVHHQLVSRQHLSLMTSLILLEMPKVDIDMIFAWVWSKITDPNLERLLSHQFRHYIN